MKVKKNYLTPALILFMVYGFWYKHFMPEGKNRIQKPGIGRVEESYGRKFFKSERTIY